MATVLDASTLTLERVHHLLGLREVKNESYSSILSLSELTEDEKQQISHLSHTMQMYYGDGKISEGQVQFLLVAPLLWLAGFHKPHLRIDLEVAIANINITDKDTQVRGRMDILAAYKKQADHNINALWVLIIESKNSSIAHSEGLPQLLTYCYQSLSQQSKVWGLTTNGVSYQFLCLENGDTPTYQILPPLDLGYPQQSQQLLQVLKAIGAFIEF